MAKTEAIEQELAELSKKQATAKPDERNAILDLIEERKKQMRRTKQIGPFKYSHQGSLAYIGADKAVADVSWVSGNFASGGTLTYLFWKSAYLSMCFSSKSLTRRLCDAGANPPLARNRLLVMLDWTKANFFGRDVSRE
jgi:NADH:ubiquinone reductase (non-electrogenic)